MVMRRLVLSLVFFSVVTSPTFVASASAKPFFLFRPFAPLFQRQQPDERDMTEEEYYRYLKRRDQAREQSYIGPDGSYYDPSYDPPPPRARPRRAPRITTPQQKPKVATTTTKQTKPEAAPPKAADAPLKDSTATTGAVNCSKAAEIVTGYGFEAVKPGSCTGAVFSFNATRGGKNYAVKVNASTGELTEVKKL